MIDKMLFDTLLKPFFYFIFFMKIEKCTDLTYGLINAQKIKRFFVIHTIKR